PPLLCFLRWPHCLRFGCFIGLPSRCPPRLNRQLARRLRRSRSRKHSMTFASTHNRAIPSRSLPWVPVTLVAWTSNLIRRKPPSGPPKPPSKFTLQPNLLGAHITAHD